MPGIPRPTPPKKQKTVHGETGPPQPRGPLPPFPVGNNGFHPKGTKDVHTAGAYGGTIKVDALRRFLIHKGYDLPEEGGLGPRMKSALADFLNPSHVGDTLGAALRGTRITGDRDPHAWNQTYGTAKTRPKVYKPVTGKGGLLDGHGNPTPPDLSSDNPDAIDVSGITGLGADVGTTLPTTLAAKLADLKYGSSIKDAEAAVARQPGQAAQDVHDIEHWYGQVLGAQKTAGQRDSAMTNAGVGSIKDAVARIVSSLGGSANEGSGLVGAAGAQEAGTLQALGTAQDQYNADIAPLLQSESAGARTRQMAINTKDAQDLGRNLSGLKQDRGNEEASQRMGILDYNNKVNQQTFQNELALEQAKEAAALTGAKILGATTNTKVPKGAFANTSGSQKIQIANGITSSLTDENGALRSGWTPQRAVSFINAQIHSAGWDVHNPAVQSYRAAIFKTIGLVP